MDDEAVRRKRRAIVEVPEQRTVEAKHAKPASVNANQSSANPLPAAVIPRARHASFRLEIGIAELTWAAACASVRAIPNRSRLG
jgi:hypothetical protein